MRKTGRMRPATAKGSSEAGRARALRPAALPLVRDLDAAPAALPGVEAGPIRGSGGAADGRRSRQRNATRTRLARAALEVFRQRGYDGATTAEMARVADVASGTFYLYFRDKRDAYEAIARDTSRELLTRWRADLSSDRDLRGSIERALRLAVDIWRSDLDRARLLVEGGPALGGAAHFVLVDEVARSLAELRHSAVPAAGDRGRALLLVATGIEMGRVLARRPAAEDELEALIGATLAAF